MISQDPLRRVGLRLSDRLRRESPRAAYVLMSERGTHLEH